MADVVVRPFTGLVVRPNAGASVSGVSALLAQGRAAAERLMEDECEIVRVTGSDTDLDTGEVTETTDPVYDGPCQVQQPSSTAGDDTAGEAELLMVGRVLKLPVDTSAGVRAGDRVLITASAHDADLVGRRFTVRAEFSKSHATARRLGIDEVTS